MRKSSSNGFAPTRRTRNPEKLKKATDRKHDSEKKSNLAPVEKSRNLPIRDDRSTTFWAAAWRQRLPSVPRTWVKWRFFLVWPIHVVEVWRKRRPSLGSKGGACVCVCVCEGEKGRERRGVEKL